MTLELPESGDCVFCAIVAGNTEARWEVRPNESGPEPGASNSAVACFHNQLKWARVMLLIVPSEHMTQTDFWSSRVLIDAAELAVKMGDKHCTDDGYRVISNFGRVAHQSQAHAHLHLVSGTSDQLREAGQKSQDSLTLGSFDVGSSDFVIDEYDVDEVSFAVEVSPSASSSSSPVTQREFWGSQRILDASHVAQRIGGGYSPEGFRLMSSFDPASATDAAPGHKSADPPGNNLASLFLLGGGQLGLYV